MKANIELAFGALIVWQVVFLPIGYFFGWGWAYIAFAVHTALCYAAIYNMVKAGETAHA